MSANGEGGIYFLKPSTTMDGAKYAELLKDKLLTHMAIHQSLIFMHDGALCHWSKIVKQFLTENHITILHSSGNSPNLNPIKNLWCKKKDLISQKQPVSSSKLIKVIKEVWVKEISGKIVNPSYTICLIDCKLLLMLMKETQSTKNVCIYVINIIIYMFPSFSYDMIAIYFSLLHQNSFFVEKAINFRMVRYFCE